MINKGEQPTVTTLVDKAGFVKTQLEQAFETFRVQFSLLVQVITILVLGDVTIIGYAISAQIAGIILIGIIFPLMTLYILYRMSRLAIPVIYTAISIENKYGGDDTDWLASTYASTMMTVEFVTKLKAISSIQDAAERTQQLRHLKAPLVGGSKGLTRIALVILAIGQIVAPVILALYFNWRLF